MGGSFHNSEGYKISNKQLMEISSLHETSWSAIAHHVLFSIYFINFSDTEFSAREKWYFYTCKNTIFLYVKISAYINFKNLSIVIACATSCNACNANYSGSIHMRVQIDGLKLV